MKIPDKFQKKLEGDQEKLGIVNKTASDFSKILTYNKLEFFPGYTDHGINHIECVLNTTEKLITEDSFAYLNATDITIIILSVIIHDIGMHLTHPGFLRLINGNYDSIIIKDFDKNNWLKSWELFLQEAKKFNQKQLLDIFGDKNISVNESPKSNLSDNDRKLIGEFVRRNHPRLAHEIAINGFPSSSGNNIDFAYGLNNHLKDLIGLVGRSHGIPLRNAIEYLKNKYNSNWFNPLDIKIIYVMGLLRIADYMHINPDRADSLILKTKDFSSPKSKQEWEKGNSIIHVYFNNIDPELITVQAEPINSLMYLELSKLFKDIQKEFDTTWAVLGEVYGRNDQLNKLKYKFRRIVSNIDDKDEFSKKINYIPEKIIFDAEPEILKLLVGPLYGKNPTYGVRELLQNAVDACRERQFLIEKNFGKESSEYKEYQPIINISICKNTDDGEYYFIMSDNGIGMTKDILINYYFKAGASFINSDIWKNNFIEDNDSVIQRSGRFGVGVLASFLLGDTIELQTKSYEEEKGYILKASIDSEQIEINLISFNIGTEIKIRLRNDVVDRINNLEEKRYGTEKNKLNWFTWYRMLSPKIIYNIDSEIQDHFFYLSDNEFIPDYNENNKNWRNSIPKDFKKISWTFSLNKYTNYLSDMLTELDIFSITNYNNIFCNGFCIPGANIDFNHLFNNLSLIISVFDYNAKLPLTLNRNYLESKKLTFLPIIFEDIFNDLVARLLTLNITEKVFSLKSNEELYIEYMTKIYFIGDLIFRNNGFYLLCDHVLDKLNIEKVTYIWFLEYPTVDINFTNDENKIIYISKSKSILSFNNRVNNMNDPYINYSYSLNDLINLKSFNSKRLLMRKDRFNYFFNRDKMRANKDIIYSFKEENQISKNWINLISINNIQGFEIPFYGIKCPDNYKCTINFDEIEKNKNNIELIVECYFIKSNIWKQTTTKYLENALDKYLSPDYVIPYDMEERKRKFPKAFKELDRFIKNYV